MSFIILCTSVYRLFSSFHELQDRAKSSSLTSISRREKSKEKKKKMKSCPYAADVDLSKISFNTPSKSSKGSGIMVQLRSNYETIRFQLSENIKSPMSINKVWEQNPAGDYPFDLTVSDPKLEGWCKTFDDEIIKYLSENGKDCNLKQIDSIESATEYYNPIVRVPEEERYAKTIRLKLKCEGVPEQKTQILKVVDESLLSEGNGFEDGSVEDLKRGCKVVVVAEAPYAWLGRGPRDGRITLVAKNILLWPAQETNGLSAFKLD